MQSKVAALLVYQAVLVTPSEKASVHIPSRTVLSPQLRIPSAIVFIHRLTRSYEQGYISHFSSRAF